MARSFQSDAAATLEFLAEVDAYNAAVARGVNGANASYRLGRLDRATRHNNPQARSGDAAVMDSADLMHRRMSDMKRNNSHIKRLSEAIPDLIVGTGVQTLADPFEPWLDLADLTPDDLDERLAYALESDEVFTEWALDPKQVDVAGKLALPDMQRLFVSELVRRGACLLVRSMASGQKIPLRYQILEADQLDVTKDTVGLAPGSRIVNGIELDAYGREIAYWIYDVHPDDTFSRTATSTRVPADRVLHCYRPDRPSQNVGATWLHSIGQNEFDRDQFLSTELQSSKVDASMVLVHKKRRPGVGGMGLTDALDAEDQYGNPEVKLGSSPLAATIGTDEEIELVGGNRPRGTSAPFFELLDRYTAAGAGVSYYTLTGNYEKTSFSSARAAKLDEDQHIKPIQAWFARQFAMPIRKDFNRLAIATGMLTTVSAREFLANEARYQRFEAMGPGREMIDPKAETEAASGRLRSGLSTLKLECAARGLHWVRVLRQIALENHVANMLGVVLDFSKGQGGQVTGNTREATQDTEANA